MPLLYTGELIAKLRKRKKWQQERLLEELSNYAPTLYRLEQGEQVPRTSSLKTVMETLEAPLDDMIYPQLENQPMAVYPLRYRLQQALDNKNLNEAEELFGELKKLSKFHGNVNRQFFLCQKARLLELQENPVEDIMPLVLEALSLTYENLASDSPGDNVLIFEEPELFHVLASCYARKSDISRAIIILKDTYEGLLRMPSGERERERRVLPMIITLSELYKQTKSFDKALEMCDFGLMISATYCLGQSTPELLYLKACILFCLNPEASHEKLLKMAVAGHMLLGEREKALEIIASANSEFGYELNTYGIENIAISLTSKTLYAQGEMVKCKTIGEMIRELRKQAGLNLKDLSRGICSVANLGKIENNDIRGHVHYVEPILQRLGRDPLLYCNFFLSKEDFEARKLRDSIHMLLTQLKFDEASQSLNKLKTYKAYKSRANLQFVKRVEAELFALDHSESHQETQKMLLDAIAITLPDFDEHKIRSYPLSLDESIIIHELANSAMESGDLDRAANIFEALIDNMDRRIVDEFEKARLYGAAMFNYSTCLGRLDKISDAMEIIDKAEKFDRNRGRLTVLGALAFNKAYNLNTIGDKKQSFKFFVLSYYEFSIFENYGREAYIKITQDLVKEFFGVDLD